MNEKEFSRMCMLSGGLLAFLMICLAILGEPIWQVYCILVFVMAGLAIVGKLFTQVRDDLTDDDGAYEILLAMLQPDSKLILRYPDPKQPSGGCHWVNIKEQYALYYYTVFGDFSSPMPREKALKKLLKVADTMGIESIEVRMGEDKSTLIRCHDVWLFDNFNPTHKI